MPLSVWLIQAFEDRDGMPNGLKLRTRHLSSSWTSLGFQKEILKSSETSSEHYSDHILDGQVQQEPQDQANLVENESGDSDKSEDSEDLKTTITIKISTMMNIPSKTPGVNTCPRREERMCSGADNMNPWVDSDAEYEFHTTRVIAPHIFAFNESQQYTIDNLLSLVQTCTLRARLKKFR